MNISDKGFEIIRKYEPDAHIEPAHDQIFVGDYATSEKMTEEERKEMEELGWFEESDSWSHFT
mgnify:CR=1 FL=1